MKKKIIIIEQDEITRRTLETILSCDENLIILGSHESSEGILKQIMKLSPHLIIIGLEGNHHEITTAMAIKKRITRILKSCSYLPMSMKIF